jgi:endonuclease/exonuclease/phosphatase family metal-dependent hydrolase
MKIASFNVENLFERARVLNSNNWAEEEGSEVSRWSAGRAALNAYSQLNALLRKTVYSAPDKAAIIEHLRTLGLERSDESALVILRQNRGRLVRRPRGGGIDIVANGRDDWIGWLDLKKEAVDEVATQNTARVLNDLDADIVVLIEAENRTSLCRFNEQVLRGIGAARYEHVMLIDGNDERGIDVGLLTRRGAVIDSVRSHVDDRDGRGVIFSRDCPEYRVKLASGAMLVVLANHLKSKGYGAAAVSNARRLAQAQQVRAIYDRLRAEGVAHIAVCGDLNDTPDSAPLAPLLSQGSELRDISAHSGFDDGGRPGTFGNGTRANKIDYILLSPSLFDRVARGGIFRKGVWGGKNGTLWEHYPEMSNANQAASDHAAIWAEIDL